MNMFKTLMIFLLFMNIPISLGCSFDTDCNVGSKCLKQSGQLYGICAGGINPGNSYDEQPVYSPTDINQSYGNTCQFHIDCGVNAHCMKSAGSLYGVCIN